MYLCPRKLLRPGSRRLMDWQGSVHHFVVSLEAETQLFSHSSTSEPNSTMKSNALWQVAVPSASAPPLQQEVITTDLPQRAVVRIRMLRYEKVPLDDST